MSQHVAANVVRPDYRQPAPQMVPSRLSAAGERRHDILGLSMWEGGAPRLPQDAMNADRRHRAVFQPSPPARRRLGNSTETFRSLQEQEI